MLKAEHALPQRTMHKALMVPLRALNSKRVKQCPNVLAAWVRAIKPLEFLVNANLPILILCYFTCVDLQSSI